MFHYVYKTTIVGTNEYYIGKHSTDKLDDSYRGSGVDLKIRRSEGYAIEFDIIEMCETEDEAYLREEYHVGDLWKTDPLCLNRCKGGRTGYAENQRGIPKTEEWKTKIGASNSKPKSEAAAEAARKNSKKGADARRGMKDSPEVIVKRAKTLSESLLGIPQYNRRKKFRIDGVVYLGYEEVFEKLGVSKYITSKRVADATYPNWELI